MLGKTSVSLGFIKFEYNKHYWSRYW